MKKLVFILALLLTATALLPMIAAGCSRSAPAQDSLVQVWSAPSAGAETRLLSSGVVVGDGLHVLTVMNYVDYSPGPLQIVAAANKRYDASIQAIDPRSGLTLLRFEGKKLSAAATGQPPSAGETVLTRAWDGSNWSVNYRLRVAITPALASDSLFFNAYAEQIFGPQLSAGTVVTDSRGKVIGLAEPIQDGLAIRTGVPSPLIARIDAGMGLFDPGAASAPWADGPALTALGGQSSMLGDFAGVLPPPSDYDGMTTALQSLFGDVGGTLPTDDLRIDRNPMWYDRSLDGTLLIAVYAAPVSLRGRDGEALTTTKWVGIQWDRSDGKPNRLVYGSRPYIIDGGYEVITDLTGLKASLPPFRGSSPFAALDGFTASLAKVQQASISAEVLNYGTGKQVTLNRGTSDYSTLLKLLRASNTTQVTNKRTTVIENGKPTTIDVTVPYAYGIILTFKMTDGAEVKLDCTTDHIWFETDQAIFQASISPELYPMLEAMVK